VAPGQGAGQNSPRNPPLAHLAEASDPSDPSDSSDAAPSHASSGENDPEALLANAAAPAANIEKFHRQLQQLRLLNERAANLARASDTQDEVAQHTIDTLKQKCVRLQKQLDEISE
jgi:hypothetical protein